MGKEAWQMERGGTSRKEAWQMERGGTSEKRRVKWKEARQVKRGWPIVRMWTYRHAIAYKTRRVFVVFCEPTA